MTEDSRVDAFREVEARVLARLLPDSTEGRVGPRSSIRVVEAGAGPPIVFLHGITGTLTNFASLAACLAPTHRCLLVDLPGHGLSGRLDLAGRHPREVLVEAVGAVIDEVAGGGPAVIVGNSLGGMTGLWLAADRPEVVEALAVLGEPAYAFPGARARFPLGLIGRRRLGPLLLGAPPPPLALYARTVRRGFGPTAIEAMGRDVLDANRLGVWAGRHARSTAGLMHSLMGSRGLAAEGIALDDADYGRIQVPVWFLWGTDDVFLSPEDGRASVERLPRATIDVVAGGHLPWFDAPDLACRRIASLT